MDFLCGRKYQGQTMVYCVSLKKSFHPLHLELQYTKNVCNHDYSTNKYLDFLRKYAPKFLCLELFRSEVYTFVSCDDGISNTLEIYQRY
jgi:hypothetical protein